MTVLVSSRRRLLEKELRQKANTASNCMVSLVQRRSANGSSSSILLFKELCSYCQLLVQHAASLVKAVPTQNATMMKAVLSLSFAAAATAPSSSSSTLHHAIPTELRELKTVFTKLYGEKFVQWAIGNAYQVNAELVTKLTTNPRPSRRRQQQPPPAAIHKKGNNKPGINNQKNPNPRQNEQSEHTKPSVQTQSSVSSHQSSVITISKLSPRLPIWIFRPNPRLEIAFDVRTKNPVYVLEHLDARQDSSKPNKNGKNSTTQRYNFYQQEQLPTEYRTHLKSFLHSCYDRGHLAARANYLGDEKLVRDTFNICNISPQQPSMNRSIWFQLEHACRKIAQQEVAPSSSSLSQKHNNKSVYIVTGPVWLPKTTVNANETSHGRHEFQFGAIGTNNTDAAVHVPTHFFKFVAVISSSSSLSKAGNIGKFACFLVPNAKPPPKASMQDFTVSWGQLEMITGLQFFPHLATRRWKQRANQITQNLL